MVPELFQKRLTTGRGAPFPGLRRALMHHVSAARLSAFIDAAPMAVQCVRSHSAPFWLFGAIPANRHPLGCLSPSWLLGSLELLSFLTQNLLQDVSKTPFFSINIGGFAKMCCRQTWVRLIFYSIQLSFRKF